ncbi:MAG: hypothetical protein OEX00_05225 [Gammaproteobacteria bacterium]|nr:hypothetical protein [Gammaproteobacteria bacterium]MDH5694198.1 hypothetical protein [Gammaproteobacteria bacterium]
MTKNSFEFDNLPDARDGLTRKERIVLYCLHQLQEERGGRNAPTVMLYGRVLEFINISENELQQILQRLSDYNQKSET